VVTADLDDDGDEDPITVGGLFVGEQVWWENDGHGQLTPHFFETIYHYMDSLDTADIDGDGNIDVISGTLPSWWENDGSANFTEHRIENSHSDATKDVFSADIDGDHDLDVLGAIERANTVLWWENDGSPEDDGWIEHIIDDGFDFAQAAIAIDLDGDDDLDVLGAASGDDQIVWWENDGDPLGGGWTKHIVSDVFSGAYDVYAIDLDEDGFIDVVGAGWSGSQIAWWENDGTPHDGGWTEHGVTSDFYGANGLEVADLEGDGDLDIVGCAFGDDTVDWWENDGDLNFTRHSIADIHNAEAVSAVDLDHDSDLDLVAVGWSGADLSWWENISTEYRIHVKTPYRLVGSRPGYQLDEGTIEVDLRNPMNKNGSYGILFGLSADWGEFYDFEIDSSGNFWLWRYNSGSGWTSLSQGTSAYIYLGVTKNHLSVLREGSKIELYANDDLITTVQDNSFTGMRYVGLVASSNSQSDLDVRFDNFVVYPISCGLPTVSEGMTGPQWPLLEEIPGEAWGMGLER
jgi:hypothetical protein